MEHPPKKINGVYGYRTNMSMKNIETWKFAHEYCGRLWFKIGRALLIVSVAASFYLAPLGVNPQGAGITILVLSQTAILVASIFPTEKALRERFDRNGNVKK
ncbi:SdpI family protein [Clostridium aminobutyricum]|nr:SdpI family protein [Clostridium aminobutyricum]